MSTSYDLTTLEQREKMFQIWQDSGNISQACREAKVSRSTFYTWKERFVEGGFPALKE